MIHSRLLQLAGAVGGQIAMLAALGIALSASAVAVALALAAALGHLVSGRPSDAAGALTLALAVVLLRALLLWAQEVFAARSGLAIRARLRDALIGRLSALGPAWAQGNRSGLVNATVVGGVDGLDAYYSRYLPQLFVVAVAPTAILVGLFTVYAPAATVLAIAVGVAVVLPRFWDARLLLLGRTRWRSFETLAADYTESTQSVALLRTFGAGVRTGAQLSARSTELLAMTMRQMKVSLVEGGVSALAAHLGVALTVVVAVVGAANGAIPQTTVFVFLLCARECFRPLNDLARHWHAGYQGLSAVDGIDDILGARPPVADTGTRGTPASAGGSLFLRGVSYRYASGAGIEDVDITVRAGTTVALTGPSGSGKSTIARLLERHFDPSHGSIELDGTPLSGYSLDALRSSIAVVSQESYLFHGTIAENLLLARPDAGAAEMRAAAHCADAHDFIRALPAGYETVLDERGSQLSGGERQRLALARGLLARTPLLVLDEVTSALDLDTERRIIDRLAAFATGQTRLVIAHRHSALRDADERVYLEAGRRCSPTLGSQTAGVQP